MHSWPGSKGVPGAICSGCGKRYGERGRAYPVAPAPAPPASLPERIAESVEQERTEARTRNAALAARWAQKESPSATESPTGGAAAAVAAAPGEALSPADTASLARTLRPFVADGLIAAERWVIDWRGYIPKDPDPEQREDLHECVEVLLARILPDVAVGPWGKFGISMTLLYGSMRIGAEKKPEAVAASPSGADATAKPAPNPAPSLTLVSSQPKPNSEVSGAGVVETVAPAASE